MATRVRQFGAQPQWKMSNENVQVSKRAKKGEMVAKPKKLVGAGAGHTACRPLGETTNNSKWGQLADAQLAAKKKPTVTITTTAAAPISTTQPAPTQDEEVTMAWQSYQAVAINKDDEIFCTEYFEDIYVYLMECEKRVYYLIHPGFFDLQTEVTINNRRVLVDWIIKIHAKFNLSHETLFAAIDLIDRVLQVGCRL